jgi:hypothetical protein
VHALAQRLALHSICYGIILVARINAPRINTRHPQNLISRFDALLWGLKAYHEVQMILEQEAS